MSKWFCTKAKKARYRDELDAMIALANMSSDDRAKRREQRAYRCPSCRGWHLTSQPKRA